MSRRGITNKGMSPAQFMIGVGHAFDACPAFCPDFVAEPSFARVTRDCSNPAGGTRLFVERGKYRVFRGQSIRLTRLELPRIELTGPLFGPLFVSVFRRLYFVG